MTALAQGTAGLALVMCFALLRTGQISAAVLLLAAQSGAVAVTALVLHQPMMAIPPLALGGGIWLMRHQTPMLDPITVPTGGAKLGITIGTVLAMLCQSQADFALPSAVVLLSILLAATRSHPMMQIVALVAAQNGLSLAGCLVAQPTVLPAALLVPMACLSLPLPVIAGLLAPALASSSRRDSRGLWAVRLSKATALMGWVDLAIAAIILTTTLIKPLDTMGSVFAPLIGLDGLMRSLLRRNRRKMPVLRRIAALAQTVLTILVICTPNLIVAWLAMFTAMAMALLPTLPNRWSSVILANLASGLALFGMLMLAVVPSTLGYFVLLAGFVAVSAVVPDLAVVLALLILRLINQASWPPVADALGTGIAVVALLACAYLLTVRAGLHRIALLHLSQASIAVLAICSGQPQGRFAGLILLILLILTRAAARVTVGPAAVLAVAGLSGFPPLGVFPGLALVVLAISAQNFWLLLPLGLALMPIFAAGSPRRFVDLAPRKAFPSIAWLPLVLAALAGYVAPNEFIGWWRILAGGRT